MRLRIVLVVLASLAAPLTVSSQPKALAELFSNFNCKNCRQPDDKYYTFLKSHPEVVLISYHNSNTDPLDQFYTHSVSADTRDKFYGGPLTDPNGFFDGASPGPNSDPEPLWETFTNFSLSN